MVLQAAQGRETAELAVAVYKQVTERQDGGVVVVETASVHASVSSTVTQGPTEAADSAHADAAQQAAALSSSASDAEL